MHVIYVQKWVWAFFFLVNSETDRVSAPADANDLDATWMYSLCSGFFCKCYLWKEISEYILVAKKSSKKRFCDICFLIFHFTHFASVAAAVAMLFFNFICACKCKVCIHNFSAVFFHSYRQSRFRLLHTVYLKNKKIYLHFAASLSFPLITLFLFMCGRWKQAKKFI